MSFLTPLYLLGALAVALPIIAHLIRRTPPRRREFSSVMFLTPSLPKVTRRSRIEHWSLLCLRTLVILLLAFAFSRPLWRTPAVSDESAAGKWAAVLLDTSASMRRSGVWDEALRSLESQLGEFGPADRVGVFTFDSAPHLVWSWEAWTSQDPAQRVAAVKGALSGTTPTWHATDLSQALITAAESLENETGSESRAAPREIVIVTDLQAGSMLNALHGYAWPENIPLRVVRVGIDASADNAGLQPAVASDGTVRVRVTNAAGASAEAFQLRWQPPTQSTGNAATSTAVTSADATPAAIDAVVPAGQSRIVRMPEPPSGALAAQLTLSGDDELFDNTCSVVVPQQRRQTIVYLGSDDPTDPAGLRFFVPPLFADTAERDVEIVDWDRSAPQFPATDAPIGLVLVTEPPVSEQLPALHEYLRSGGLLINVLRTPEAATGLAQLAHVAEIPASEAEVHGFSLLTDVDFEHPALAPFSDPKYSDFTTLHFWKHRSLDVSALPSLRALARFDNGDLAIGELPVEDGRIVVFTSGWSRADSQLAVWSKFVPLMNSLFEGPANLDGNAVQLVVGNSIPWQSLLTPVRRSLQLIKPDKSTQTLSADERQEVVAEAPGIYTLTDGADPAPLATYAVNLPPAESNIAPLGIEQLEALGIPMSATNTAPIAAAATPTVDLATAELEQRQRLWRWVLLAVLGLLIVETIWAGRLTARHPT
jgi:hypothetical protein